MKSDLPKGADPIYVEWPIKEGGVLAAAWTDNKGKPYIAIKTLNRIGKPSGLYDWQRCRRLTVDMVVGFIEDRPLVVRVGVRVTVAGIELIITMPPDIKSASDFIERRFSLWGSEPPPVVITLQPTTDHYALTSF